VSKPDLRVEIDTSKLEKYARRLAEGLDKNGMGLAREFAEQTAAAIRQQTPVLTGRLQSSISVVPFPDGYGVTYGGGVPYARKAERREHMVKTNVDSATQRYPAEAHSLAEKEAHSA
jgi:hypothetical protein